MILIINEKIKPAIFILIFLLTSGASAVKAPDAAINWQKGYIKSTGTASIKVEEKGVPVDYNTGSTISINRARRDSYLQARDNAIEKIIGKLKSLRIDPENRIDDLLHRDKFTQRRLSDKMTTSLVIKEYPLDFYRSACELKLNFYDILTALPYNYPENDFPGYQSTPLSSYYSSLIIDARGLDVKPMLLPSVYNEDGLEIYGRHFIEAASLLDGGMISYCYDENEAMRNERAGDRPFFTVALKSLKSCPVISEKASRRILGDPETIINLKKCRVIFIIDREEE